MTEALKQLIAVDDIIKNGTKNYCSPLYAAEMYAKGLCPLSDVEAAIRSAMTAGATSMVETMEGFVDWIDRHGWIKAMAGYWFNDSDERAENTSQLLEIYFEQLKKERGMKGLTESEWQELLTLEYVLTWNYTNDFKSDEKRYIELSQIKWNYGLAFNSDEYYKKICNHAR